MTPLVAAMAKIAPDPETFMWFDASALHPGESVPLDTLNDTPLPFDLCAIAFDPRDGGRALALLRQVGDTVGYIGRSIWPSGYVKHPAITYTRTVHGLQISYPGGGEKQESLQLLAAVAGWLKALSPGGATAYKPTARPSLINSKRAAKGKGPVLFDWHTVTIAPPTPKADHKGGTHATPRLHDRRGPNRRLWHDREIHIRPRRLRLHRIPLARRQTVPAATQHQDALHQPRHRRGCGGRVARHLRVHTLGTVANI